MCQTVFKINDNADTTRYWSQGKGTAISKIHSITSKLNFVSKANSTPRHKHHQNGYSQWPQWNTCPSRFPAEYIQESSHDWHFMYYLKMAFTDSNYQQHNLKQQCDQCYPHCKVIISI